ncbi:MAG: GDYXXLXY domain-containing protein [Nanoarchaeota archaeon]
MKKQLISVIIVSLVVLLVVVSFLLYNEWPHLTGKKIVLDTRPVDPFDPLRGQYMQISYEISILNSTNLESGDIVYVKLKEDSKGIWRFVDSSKNKPSQGDFIKGKVTSIYGNRANVEYGIEQYFFERNAEIPTQNITVEVVVTNSGRAELVQLLQNGKPVKIDYQEFDIRN